LADTFKSKLRTYIILIASWCGISYWMIFFLVGLQEIPNELYESAKIDGSNNWNAFWKITLPLLKRTILFVTVADTSANFLLFVPSVLLVILLIVVFFEFKMLSKEDQ